MPAKKKAPNFEQSLQSLEALVNKMEAGELSLEDSLKAFEEGVTLTRECQSILAQAEQKVEILMESEGEMTKQPFISEEDV